MIDNRTDIVAGEPSPQTVYVIDDNLEMRKSLHFLLSTLGMRSWPFPSGLEFLEQLDHLAPAPILLDMRMSGLDGHGVLTELSERDVRWPTIMMTGHGDIAIAVNTMKLGAIDFLEKPFEAETLEVALKRGFALLADYLQGESRRAVAVRMINSLSRREAEVIDGLVSGLPNKLVAHRLGLSTRTVEMHRANAIAKLEGRSMAEVATILALAKGKANGESAALFPEKPGDSFPRG